MKIQSPLYLLVALLVATGCSLVENYDDPEGPRYAAEFAARLEGGAAELEEFTVCTFNIEFAQDIEQAIHELQTNPQLSSCAVLLLQEMDWPGSQSIAEALLLDVVYYPGSVHSGKDFGNAVLSSWPIVTDAKLVLPHRNPTNGRIRIAVSATLDAPFAPLTVFSVHTDTPWLGPAARLEQAEAIAADAARFEGPIVVGGDFNTLDPGAVDATVGRFTSRHFTWATEDAPDTGSAGVLGTVKIDHLFVRELRVTAAGTEPTEASDHQPLWATLRTRP